MGCHFSTQSRMLPASQPTKGSGAGFGVSFGAGFRKANGFSAWVVGRQVVFEFSKGFEERKFPDKTARIHPPCYPPFAIKQRKTYCSSMVPFVELVLISGFFAVGGQ